MILTIGGTARAEDLLFQFGGAGTGNGEFGEINGIDVGDDGRIYVVDAGNSRVQIFDANGTFVDAFGSPGVGDGEFENACGITVDAQRDRIYVSEGVPGDVNHRVQVFDLAGTPQPPAIGVPGVDDGEFDSPCQMDVDADGNLYVVDSGNNRVQVFDATGAFVRVIGAPGAGDGEFTRPSGITLDALGRIYVADSFAARIQVFSSSGNFLRKFGSFGPADGQLDRPCHIAQFGLLYVADAKNARVQVFDLEGISHDSFGPLGSGPSQFCSNTPLGLATDAFGRIYVEDGNFVKVFSIDRDGDGLLDIWETSGVDFDGDGIVDLPLDQPPFDADPDHKDLYLEIDWMAGQAPNQRGIQRMKRAFALAPIDAGGIPNPDENPGITLHVDTGNLTVGSEDGAGAGSCTDGVDNGGGDEDGDGISEVDSADPDCIGIEGTFLSNTCFDGVSNGFDFQTDAADSDCMQLEDGVGPATCGDGIDNGGDGLTDAADPDCQGIEDGFGATGCTNGLDDDTDTLVDADDPDCLVGDDLAGGNAVPFSNVSGLTAAFYQIKGNPSGSEDGAGAGSCSDGLDNGPDGLADAADPDCENNFRAARRLVFRYALSAGQPTNSAGTSTGSNGATTLNDTAQSWIANEWAGRNVRITGGLGAGQSFRIASNTANQLTIVGGWALVPDATSTYQIKLIGGEGEIGGNDFIEFGHDGGTVMHELGHTLNLRHGGFENANCKPNYVSGMNYDYQFGIRQIGGGRIIDFSPPRFFGGTGRGVAPLPTLLETSLDEAILIDPTDLSNRFRRQNTVGTKSITNVNGDVDNDGPGDGDLDCKGDGVDWDDDGCVPTTNSFVLDIDGGGPCTANGLPTESGTGSCSDGDDNDEDGLSDGDDPDCQLQGFDDWTNLSLGFLQFADSGDGSLNAVEEPEPTLKELIEAEIELTLADLSIAKSAEPDPVEVGEDLVYRLTVRNLGLNPASMVIVEDALPAGAPLVAAPASCTEAAPGMLVCNLGELSVGDEHDFEITVGTADVCEMGLPGVLENTARVENTEKFAGSDPNPLNDTASLAVTPLDTTGPEIVCNAPLSIRPPDAPISFTATASDLCDPAPEASIVAFDCFKFTKKGERVDKTTSCGVTLEGDTVTIEDSGGVGDHITWTVRAVDASGNPSEETCALEVVRPSCGLGFELAFLLAPLMWLHQRRRRRMQ